MIFPLCNVNYSRRNRKGKIVKATEFQGDLPSGSRARVEPNRRWFGMVLSTDVYYMIALIIKLLGP